MTLYEIREGSMLDVQGCKGSAILCMHRATEHIMFWYLTLASARHSPSLSLSLSLNLSVYHPDTQTRNHTKNTHTSTHVYEPERFMGLHARAQAQNCRREQIDDPLEETVGVGKQASWMGGWFRTGWLSNDPLWNSRGRSNYWNRCDVCITIFKYK